MDASTGSHNAVGWCPTHADQSPPVLHGYSRELVIQNSLLQKTCSFKHKTLEIKRADILNVLTCPMSDCSPAYIAILINIQAIHLFNTPGAIMPRYLQGVCI